MKSYLSLIPISAKVHRRQNRMTLLCIVFAVFMVTAVSSSVRCDESFILRRSFERFRQLAICCAHLRSACKGRLFPVVYRVC